MRSQEVSALIRTLYDEHVANSEVAVALAESRQRLIPVVARELEKADRDFEAEASILIDKVLTDTRSARNVQMKDNLADIAAFLVDPEANILAVLGMLDLAYPLGTPRGEDKSLRRWTVYDLDFKVKARYREASQTTAAATLLDEAAGNLMNEMFARGVVSIGELLDELLPDENEAAEVGALV